MAYVCTSVKLTVFGRKKKYNDLPFRNIPHDPSITKMTQLIIYPASNGSNANSLNDGFSNGFVNLQTNVE